MATPRVRIRKGPLEMLRTSVTRFLYAVVGGLFLAFPSGVRADLSFQTVGDPFDGGSWFQAFHVNSSAEFENIGLVVWSGDETAGFETPAWNFTLRPDEVNPHMFTETFSFGDSIAAAHGNATDTLTWESHFAGEKEDQSFTMSLFVWDDPLRNIGAAAAAWDGETWDLKAASNVTWEDFQSQVGIGIAPVPSALLLGTMGLLIVGWIRSRGA